MPAGIFYRTSLTSPQISAARHIARGSRPAQGTEALRPSTPDAARIALLPLRKLCHGNN